MSSGQEKLPYLVGVVIDNTNAVQKAVSDLKALMKDPEILANKSLNSAEFRAKQSLEYFSMIMVQCLTNLHPDGVK